MEKKIEKKNVIIVIPTYNEAENIENLIVKIYSLPIDPSVLILDDNSLDGTSSIIKKLQVHYPKLYLIDRERKLGLASALKEGFQFALEKGYDVIIQMDGDLSHSPGSILEMIDLLSQHDLVIGSRYVENGGALSWGLGRVLMSRLGNIYAKTLLQIPINDLTSGFKCMRREVLESFNFDSLSSKGYSFQIEVTFFSFLKGFKIREHPIIFKGRMDGKSKMSSGIALEAFGKVILLSFLQALFFHEGFCGINSKTRSSLRKSFGMKNGWARGIEPPTPRSTIIL
ncbi:MAG: polyprenol monophosphomannose synthase [Candidatus Omnitrophota bacterium]